MSYWIHEAGNKNSSLWRFFMCDYSSDIKNLPLADRDGQPQLNDTVCKNRCSPGSQCLCLEDNSIYILGKDTNKWIKKVTSQSGSSSGGISGDIEDVEPIPSSSIQSLFQ